MKKGFTPLIVVVLIGIVIGIFYFSSGTSMNEKGKGESIVTGNWKMVYEVGGNKEETNLNFDEPYELRGKMIGKLKIGEYPSENQFYAIDGDIVEWSSVSDENSKYVGEIKDDGNTKSIVGEHFFYGEKKGVWTAEKM